MENKPTGIDERPEQFRPPIIKAKGVTDSERYLAMLADKSFLNLWSYPSLFRDQKQARKGDGKEICDLLVVCDRHIIIFSEKTIKWPHGDLNTAWCRWSKRAVQSSAKQAKGAERWIVDFSDRIFLDRECTNPFPIDLPKPEERIIHKVVVARGASHACQVHLSEGSGSLTIKPDIVGNDHWSNGSPNFQPFAIGDIDPSGSFVHVFDEVALDIVLKELDTIRDFTDYLEKREAFIRSGKLAEAHGEENLLAYYAIRINDDGDHDFALGGEEPPITIDRQRYERLLKDPRYIAKKQADKISYLWDMLIEAFTNHMLDGTSITMDGYKFDLKESELSVRYMALQQRFIRRSHGEAVKGALDKGMKHDRFFRVMFSPEHGKENETAFFIQTVKYLDWMEQKGGYEQYRRKRTDFSRVYAKGLLVRYPHLKRVVGISREPLNQGRGISEDLVYAEQAEWTEEDRRAIIQECEIYGVLQGELKERPWHGDEFPEVVTVAFQKPNTQPPVGGMNRKQRRAIKCKGRRKKK